MAENLDDDFSNVKVSWWQRLRWWWILRKKQRCDICDGTFMMGDLSAVSGDVWMCHKCLTEYMRDEGEEAYREHENPYP